MIIHYQFPDNALTPHSIEMYPFVVHIKNQVFGVYLSKYHSRMTVSDVINVYKSNHTSQPMWNIRISYFLINKRKNLFAEIMLSNIVEVFMHFWTCETSNSNSYFNHHIEANQVNFSPFSRCELRTQGLHYPVTPYVDLDMVIKSRSFQ